jgi:putative peptidoglycan lipid II flippase
MSAIFAHGAFDRSAAELSAMALAAYGVGLPAMVLVRIVSSTFYARHDTATPAKATVTSIVANVAIKVILVWGFHLGIAGIALGTAIGAWVNVGALTWFSRRRGFLNVQPVLRRALLPILLAALAAGLGATAGVDLVKQLQLSSRLDFWIFHVPAATLQVEMALGMAALLGCAGYGAVALAFRRVLPLGRFARKQ